MLAPAVPAREAVRGEWPHVESRVAAADQVRQHATRRRAVLEAVPAETGQQVEARQLGRGPMSGMASGVIS